MKDNSSENIVDDKSSIHNFENVDKVQLYLDITNDQSVSFDNNIYALMEQAVRCSLAFENCSGQYEVDITLVDNKKIQTLNKQYREKDSVTDVLSFPQWDEVPKISNQYPIHIGDIVINVSRAEEQAQSYGHSLTRELVFLTVHSAFHLLGHDHELEDERKIMRSREEAVLDYLNVKR